MAPEEHRIRVRLDSLIAERGITLTQLAAEVGVTMANLSVLKNGRARAIWFTTLSALCDVLDCTPGDLLGLERGRDYDLGGGAECGIERGTERGEPAARGHDEKG